MGEALIGGLLGSGHDASDLAVAEMSPDRREVLEQRFDGVRVVSSAVSASTDAQIVIVAVKPADVAAVLRGVHDTLADDALVVSIAAGVSIATLEAAIPGRPVVRAMPNTAALVREGATAIAAGRHATEAHLGEAERLLGAVGTVVRVPESQLDAVTGLSGSGPAYVFLVAEALIEAGVLVGLSRSIAYDLVVQTLLGSARLLAESGEGPEELRAAVTSPGGTTAHGLRVLEDHGVRVALMDAVVAATKRSAELDS